MTVPPVTWPGATTGRVVLLGDPVAHSLSPRLHNTAFRALGLDLVYLALRVAPDELVTAVAGLGATGTVGANVTVPHKLAAAELCDELTDDARLLGAVNTLVWEHGRLLGANTDVSGLGRVLAGTVEQLAGAPAVVLGTGGSARAAVVALARGGATVTVVGRRATAAAALATLAGAVAPGAAHRGLELGSDAVTTAVVDARCIVNTTPLGMHGESLPPPFMSPEPGQVVHDLVYGASTTPYIAAATERGCDAYDGRLLLAAQAEDAFVRWTGVAPPAGLFASLLA